MSQSTARHPELRTVTSAKRVGGYGSRVVGVLTWLALAFGPSTPTNAQDDICDYLVGAEEHETDGTPRVGDFAYSAYVTVSISSDSETGSARVYQGDLVVGRTPFSGTICSDNPIVELTLRRHLYHAEVLVIYLTDGPQDLSIVLERRFVFGRVRHCYYE